MAIAKFAIAMTACTVACTAIWQCCVADVLYHCTDPLWLDYLQGPGGWVHGAVAGQPGDFGDTIEPGWSIASLKLLWFSMISANFVISLLLCGFRWNGCFLLAHRTVRWLFNS